MDVHFDGTVADPPREHLRLAHRASVGRRHLGAPVAQLGEQLSPHDAHPAELDHVPVIQRHRDGIRLRFTDRRHATERNVHGRRTAGLDVEGTARYRGLRGARLDLVAPRRDDPVLHGGHPAGVPHSPQNFAPFSAVPQLAQNFFAAVFAARMWPQFWQNFPPPLVSPQFGHVPVP
jgi:hypothetical protein